MQNFSTVLGETAGHYVPQINRAYDFLWKIAPGRPPDHKELHLGMLITHRVKDGLKTSSTEATPGEFVMAL